MWPQCYWWHKLISSQLALLTTEHLLHFIIFGITATVVIALLKYCHNNNNSTVFPRKHNCSLHLVVHLDIEEQLLTLLQKAKCCGDTPSRETTYVWEPLCIFSVWHGLHILYTHKRKHTFSLINPAALVHSIDYESQPLIRRGLNRAAALNEVTLGWLTPSHTLWPHIVTVGKSVRASVFACVYLLRPCIRPMYFALSPGNELFKNIWISVVGYTPLFCPSVFIADSAINPSCFYFNRDCMIDKLGNSNKNCKWFVVMSYYLLLHN